MYVNLKAFTESVFALHVFVSLTKVVTKKPKVKLNV